MLKSFGGDAEGMLLDFEMDYLDKMRKEEGSAASHTIIEEVEEITAGPSWSIADDLLAFAKSDIMMKGKKDNAEPAFEEEEEEFVYETEEIIEDAVIQDDASRY